MYSPLLRVSEAGKSYTGQRPLEALRNVSLALDAGDFVSIVGPSGCGKSTLFNLIAGLDSHQGIIEVRGETDPDARRRLCGYMFQKDLLLPWRNLVDNAALGIEVGGGVGRDEARRRVRELLPRFGLEGFEQHQPAELSGGMRQRVALLRTLLLQRPLLLLDEPFASLDALTRRELQAWLLETWRLGSEAALLVTHDVREAVALSDRVYVMSPRPGSIVAEIEIDRGPDGVADPMRLARAEGAVLEALHLERTL